MTAAASAVGVGGDENLNGRIIWRTVIHEVHEAVGLSDSLVVIVVAFGLADVDLVADPVDHTEVMKREVRFSST